MRFPSTIGLFDQQGPSLDLNLKTIFFAFPELGHLILKLLLLMCF